MTSKKVVTFYTLAAGTVVLDQLAKFLVRRFLPADGVSVIPGFFDLILTYNRGGAFGILPNWAPLFIIVALVAIYAIVRLGRNGLTSNSLVIGLGLLMGGALGNLIDRIFSPNRGVTDFISLHITLGDQVRAWPTFNVADIAIVLGAIFTFYHVYIVDKGNRE